MKHEVKIKFDSGQTHQVEAVDSIISLFEDFDKIDNLKREQLQGQVEKVSASDIIANIPQGYFFSERQILENLNVVRERYDVDRNCNEKQELDRNGGVLCEWTGADIHSFPEFTVEMETGTGKTYVYLRTIYELAIKNGYSKFVIIVPSVAIYEGVKTSFYDMRTHFEKIYGLSNVPLREYRDQDFNSLKEFGISNQVEILLMTIASFRSASNVIYKAQEKLPGELLPYQYIQLTNPIVILDEPQNMEGEISQRAIRTLKPLFSMRYSATHINNPNQVYRLSPIDAFRQTLLKRIQVIGITEDDIVNKPHMEIVEIKNNKAVIETNVLDRGQFITRQVELKQNDELIKKTSNDLHKGYKVINIVSTKGDEHVLFENGVRLDFTHAINASKKEIFRIQIRETIQKHIETQKSLNPKGIKVISLFFIDRVSNYVDEKNGIIRQIFNEEFNALKNTSPVFKKKEAKEVQSSYFAHNRTHNNATVYYDDITSAESKEAEKKAYELIMKDKKSLLSLEHPVEFIFAHSALKEGWDNPNVFQICTLNQTYSDRKKRQEIGRGLRICVDQTGNRVFDDNVNVLTIIANESYESYAQNLQKNYEEDGEMATVKVTDAKREPVKRNKDVYNSSEFNNFWDKINRATKYNFAFSTDELIKGCIERIEKEAIGSKKISVTYGTFNIHEVVIRLLEIKKEKCKLQITINYYDQRLFETPDKKEMFEKWFDTDSESDLSIYLSRFFKKLNVIEINDDGDESYIKLSNDSKILIDDEEVFDVSDQTVTGRRSEMAANEAYPLINLIQRAAAETSLTRNTLFKIFSGLKNQVKEKVIYNPELFAGVFIKEIKNTLASQVSEQIEFSIVKDSQAPYNVEEIFPEKPKFVQTELIDGNDKSLYNKVQIDSDIERNFLRNYILRDKDIIAFFKFNAKYKIKLPSFIQNYNPDWGVIRKSDDGTKLLELVRETKGTEKLEDLRFAHERWKINCGKKYYETLGIDYRVIDGKKPDWYLSKDALAQLNDLFPETASVDNIVFIEDYKERAYLDALPYFSLEAACGRFGKGKDVEPIGWIEVKPETIRKKKLNKDMFIVKAVGHSMNPIIKEGDYCIFTVVKAGTKNGKVLLIQLHSSEDPDAGGKYTIKKYKSDKSGTVQKIILEPENNDYEPIILDNADEAKAEEFVAVGEFVGVLTGE